jgi:hypothetical protein
MFSIKVVYKTILFELKSDHQIYRKAILLLDRRKQKKEEVIKVIQSPSYVDILQLVSIILLFYVG